MVRGLPRFVLAAVATLFAFCSLGVAAQQVDCIDVAVGVSIHGIGEYRGSLFVNDWRTGEAYAVSWNGALIQQSPLSLPNVVCDFVIEGTILYAIEEGGDEILKYSMETGKELQRIEVPYAAVLDAYDVQGIEKVADRIYLLGSDRVNERDYNVHKISVFDLGTGQVEGAYSLESPSYPDLVDLQWVEGELWTFDYSSGRLMTIAMETDTFELEVGIDVFARVLGRSDVASNGLRGFFFSGDYLVLSSTSGQDGEPSLVHIAKMW